MTLQRHLVKLLSYKYDFHIHSALSPCGDNDMTPNNIVGMAQLWELDTIAVTDHNCALNLGAVKTLCDEIGIKFIPGIELTTAEEIHILCLFSSVEKAENFGKYVYDHLPNIKNDPLSFGDQFIMDSEDNLVGTVDKLLINATDISVDEAEALVESFGGRAICAHIEKASTSTLSVLGDLPYGSKYPVIEINNCGKIEEVLTAHPDYKDKFIITDSDAHSLENIGTKQSEMTKEQFDWLFDEK